MAFAGSRVTIPTRRLRSSARIAGSVRLVVMSPTPITSQVSVRVFYADRKRQGEAAADMGKGGYSASADPSFTNLNDEGLLEHCVLFSRAHPGIPQDYANYRLANRGKLHHDLDEYVVPFGL